MSDTTANLEMPYILPSQAQKHVTHNEALQRLDAVTQLVITDRRSAPPASPAEGSCYAVAASPTGEWSGKAGAIAMRQDGAWLFITPRRGWFAFFLDTQDLQVHTGSAGHGMMPCPVSSGWASMRRRRAGTAWSLPGEASLLTHDGHGHRLTLNKAAPGETASLLFQSNWSGRAELGLAGTDEFGVKISPNGSDWLTALSIGAGGQVRTPLRPYARATRAGGSQSPVSNSLIGFSSLTLANGGVSLGTALPGGGQPLVVPVAGLYLVLLKVEADPAGAFAAAVQVNGTTTIASIRSADGGPPLQSYSASSLALLQAGDSLAIRHTGIATIDNGPDKTELAVVML